MINKIYNSLILVFFVAVLLLYGNQLSMKEYNKITNEYFNATIYLETSVNQEATVQSLKSIADKYGLTIAKVIQADTGETDIFVYSHNDQYTHNFLSSNGFLRDSQKQISIEPGDLLKIKEEGLQTFYNKRIYIRPLENLENIGVEGKYAWHVDRPSDLENLIMEINGEYAGQITIYPNQRLQNTFIQNVDELRFYYGLILMAILAMTVFTSFLYDIKSRKKEMAVKTLLGYGTGAVFYDIFMKKAAIPIVFSLFFAELIAVSFFVLHKNIGSSEILRYFLRNSLIFLLLFATALMTIFALLLLVSVAGKTLKINMVSYIKGMETSGNTLSTLVKMGSTLILIIVFGVLAVSWSFLSGKMEAVHHWEGTKDYATLNIYVPEYIMQDNKRKAEFEQTHRTIWNFMNDRGGVLFYKTTNRINQSSVLVNGKEVDIPFAYINNNYLHENPVFDVQGNRIIGPDDSNSNSLILLVPMAYRPYEEELKGIIHQKHVFDKYISEDILKEWITGKKNETYLSKGNLNNPDITERWIYIQDDQPLFTYFVGGDFVTNGIYAIVNGENMGLNVYTPSAFGRICAKTDDMKKLNQEIRVLFNELGFGEVDTDLSSVYHQNAEDVRYFKNIMGFSTVVFALSLIFLIFSLLFYLEAYFMNHRKRLAIKNFLGFSFLERNKKVFISLLAQDAMIIVLCFLIGAYFNREIVGIQILHPILAVSLLVLLFDVTCSALVLKRRERKTLAETLKGE